eukprot:1149914-Pelagomonas_calceolata.AAC.2
MSSSDLNFCTQMSKPSLGNMCQYKAHPSSLPAVPGFPCHSNHAQCCLQVTGASSKHVHPLFVQPPGLFCRSNHA